VNKFYLPKGNSKCPHIEVDSSKYSQTVSHPEGNHELE
jgi:hypothetical protein